jgi:hypothetical protein
MGWNTAGCEARHRDAFDRNACDHLDGFTPPAFTKGTRRLSCSIEG